MKYISKRGRPLAYARWCASVAGTNKENFSEVPRAEKQALLNALIEEQGALCAYTMKRIGEGSSHVEHIKPQSRCTTGEDLDYGNLVACFPLLGMKPPHRYGAQQKGGWWEDNGSSFVSPLHPNCEKRFRFGLDGAIVPANNHPDAAATIQILALDNASLTEDRKRVISEFIYGPRGSDALTAAQAKRFETDICGRIGRAQFPEFCVAIRCALGEYLRMLDRRTQRTRAIRARR